MMMISDASQRGGRLTIRNAQSHYSGQYQCTVYFVNGERRSAYATLVVEIVEQRGLLCCFIYVSLFFQCFDTLSLNALVYIVFLYKNIEIEC